MEPGLPIGHVEIVSSADEPTDREIWSRVLEQDESAMSLVYDRYSRCLLQYAYRRTTSVARGEDIVSVVMLETWRRRDYVRFDRDGSMAGWLFRTAQYVLSNERRSIRRHRVALERIYELDRTRPAEEPDQRLVDEERLRVVLAGVSGLAR